MPLAGSEEAAPASGATASDTSSGASTTSGEADT